MEVPQGMSYAALAGLPNVSVPGNARLHGGNCTSACHCLLR